MLSFVGLGLGVMGLFIVTFLGTLALKKTQPTWIFDGGVVIGAALVVVGWRQGAAWWLAAGAGATVLIWFASTRKELSLPRGSGLRVKVGDTLPSFSLAGTGGAPVTDAEVRAAAPALVVMYRGWWCPYCVTQLDQLGREHDALRAAGIKLYAISVDRSDEQAPLEKRLGGKVSFLSDPEGKLLDAIGVRHPDGVPWYDRLLLGARRQDIALPTSLLVGKDGKLLFVERARRIDQRTPLDAVLAAARSAG